MATVQQNEDEAPEKLSAINFKVTEEFKLKVDLEVTRQRTSLRDFCTRALENELKSSEDARNPDPPLFVRKGDTEGK
jgi:hypothetical protein